MTHGVLAVVGLQLQDVALSVDEDGVGVGGHPLQPELGAGRGRHRRRAASLGTSPRATSSPR